MKFYCAPSFTLSSLALLQPRALSLGLITAALITASCARQAPTAEPQSVATLAQLRMGQEVSQVDGSSSPAETSRTRRLAHTGSLALRASDTDALFEAIEERAQEAGGFVAEHHSFGDPGLRVYDLVVRVPSQDFAAFLRDTTRLAERVDEQRTAALDLTDRFVDLEARLRALEATESELLGLLTESRSRGSEVEDIMAVFRELTEVRGQIETLQGTLVSLEDRTMYSTLDMHLRPSERAFPLTTSTWRPSETFKQALRGLVTVLQTAVDVAIYLGLVVVPSALLLGLPLFVVSRAWRRLRGIPPAREPA